MLYLKLFHLHHLLREIFPTNGNSNLNKNIFLHHLYLELDFLFLFTSHTFIFKIYSFVLMNAYFFQIYKVKRHYVCIFEGDIARLKVHLPSL